MSSNTIECATSLPPRVQGVAKGLLKFSVQDINSWVAAKVRPAHLFARIVWWGDAPGVETDVPLRPDGTSVAFPIRAGQCHLCDYLRDMKELDILIMEPSDAPKAIGKVTLNTAAIADAGLAPFQQALPVIGIKTGSPIGTLPIRLDFVYSGAMHTNSLENTGVIHPGSKDGVEGVEILTPCTGLPETSLPLRNNGVGTAGSTPQDTTGTGTLGEAVKGGSSTNVTDNRCCVQVRIDSAMQLPPPPDAPGPSSSSENSSSSSKRFESSCFVYASAVWQRDRSQKVNTQLAAAQDVAAAGGYAAVWRSEVEVQVDPEAFKSAATGDLQGVLDGPLLLINVWRSGAPTPDPGTLLEELALSSCDKQPAVTTPFDRLIGCAAIDLGVLLREGQAEDRYPLVNAQHQVQGVIKACVTPNMHLAQVLNTIIRCDIYNSTAPDTELMTLHVETPRKGGMNNGGGAGAGGAVGIPTLDAAMNGDAASLTVGGQYGNMGTESMNNNDDPPITSGGVSAGESSAFPGQKFQFNARLAEKQQYAWSGSDSSDDDALGMLGVSFEGAVSCSDDETEIRAARERARNGRAPLIINQDWMFDICKNTGAKEGGGGGSDNIDVGNSNYGEDTAPAILITHHHHHHHHRRHVERQPVRSPMAEKADKERDQKKPIVFKNVLLPGVVAVGNDGITPQHTLEGGFISVHEGGGSVHTEATPVPAPALTAAIPLPGPSTINTTAIPRVSDDLHHSSLNQDWLFGIGNQNNFQQHVHQSSVPRPLPPGLTPSQFAPMADQFSPNK